MAATNRSIIRPPFPEDVQRTLERAADGMKTTPSGFLSEVSDWLLLTRDPRLNFSSGKPIMRDPFSC